MGSTIRSALEVIFYLCLFYLIILGIFYLFQRNFIYFPKHANLNPKAWNLTNIKLIQIKTSDGLTLNSWYHPAKTSNTPTILYLHGNFGHIGHRAFIIKPFIEKGYGVLLLGYRGYGGNPGQPTEQGLYRDAQAATAFLKKQGIHDSCIVLWGVSLGSGVAVQMATEFQVGAVILQSAYTSMTAVGQKHYPYLPVNWLLQDRYDSLEKINRIKSPLLILHGEHDDIIPVTFGKKLFDATPEPKVIKVYPHAGHNDLPDLSSEVINFLNKQQVCAKEN